jgi:hypothetical protein
VSKTGEAIDLARQLASVPVRNERVTVQPGPRAGSMVVEVELVYPGWVSPLRLLLRPRRTRKFLLEGIGLSVYQSIDGRKTFEQLVDGFAAEHRLTFFEGRALLAQYLQMLTRRGLVAVALKAAERRGSAGESGGGDDGRRPG